METKDLRQEVRDFIVAETGNDSFIIRDNKDDILREKFFTKIAIKTGVKLPPEPIEPVKLGLLKEIPAPDKIVYKVDDLSSVYFMDKKTAQELHNDINKALSDMIKIDYHYNAGYKHEYINLDGDVSLGGISTKRVYSKELYDKIKPDLMANLKIKEAIEKAESVNQKESEEYDQMVEFIRIRVTEAIRKAYVWDSWSSKYKKYEEALNSQREAFETFMKVEAPDLYFAKWLEKNIGLLSDSPTEEVEETDE